MSYNVCPVLLCRQMLIYVVKVLVNISFTSITQHDLAAPDPVASFTTHNVALGP